MYLLGLLFLFVTQVSPNEKVKASILVNTLDGPVLGREDQGFDERFGIWNTWNSFLVSPITKILSNFVTFT